MTTANVTTNEKLEILIDLGADAKTLTNICIVMRTEDFDSLADDLVGEFTGEGRTYDLWDWARLRTSLEGIFS